MANEPDRTNDDDNTGGKAGDAFDELKRRRADEASRAQLYQISGVGFEFISAVGGFAAIGWWLDRHFGKSPAYTLAGLAIGFAIGLYRLIQFGLRMNKNA